MIHWILSIGWISRHYASVTFATVSENSLRMLKITIPEKVLLMIAHEEKSFLLNRDISIPLVQDT